jgi:hypothetical protein
MVFMIFATSELTKLHFQVVTMPDLDLMGFFIIGVVEQPRLVFTVTVAKAFPNS